MNRERLTTALSAVLDEIRSMGPEVFRAHILANEAGELAQSLAEIESFASSHLGNDLLASAAVREAIQWGAMNAETFDLSDLEEWITANDDCFLLAA